MRDLAKILHQLLWKTVSKILQNKMLTSCLFIKNIPIEEHVSPCLMLDLESYFLYENFASSPKLLLLPLTSKTIPENILIYFLNVSLRRFLYISTQLSSRKKAIYKTLFCHCCLISHVQLFANRCTVASVCGFLRQEY